ncbi:MAG: T9SS type A sorting domain-containing protein [Bacteroidetes bacterium]|nr:T9SS type A sorting domain-containing protein [Bacteroidota bacterium]MBU1721064.1 T9SS type A sorting domain-containing protein [Bacteroidota bacterium]
MTKRVSLLILSLCFAFSIQAQQWAEKMMDGNYSFSEIKTEFYNFWQGKDYKTTKGWKQFKRWEHFMAPRVFPDNETIPPDATYRVWKQLKNAAAKSNQRTDLWQSLGPFDVPMDMGGAGRLNCIRFHPTNPNMLYAGAPAGGLWISANGGSTWYTTTDELGSIGVTDVAVNSINPDIIYIATGDGDAGDTYSIGVLKSIDGGTSWDNTGLNWAVNATRKVSRLLIHPTNPDILYAATSSGFYKTINAGQTWDQLRLGAYRDMEFKPDDPETIYLASTTRVYKSTNGGENWTTLTLSTFVVPISRIALAVTPADPEVVYALTGNSNDQGFGALYKSTNAGASFVQKSNTPNILGWETDGSDGGGQAWYDLGLAVSSTNANIVYAGGVNIWKSVNSGTDWDQIAHWYGGGGNPYVHADIHDLVCRPTDGSKVYAACDGGLFKTDNSGGSWVDLSDGISIGQIYKFSNSQTNPNVIISGWQDNGTNLYAAGQWGRVIGGDGMDCQVDYSDEDIMYGSVYYGALYRSTNGGGNFQDCTDGIDEEGDWVTPFVIDPSDPQTLVAGYSNIWKTTNRGDFWQKISDFNFAGKINVVAIAESNSDVIIVSSYNVLYKTTDGGNNWENLNDNLPYLAITGIAIHPTNPDIFWLTYSGYSNGNRVFRTDDGGVTWINISDNLPNIPANCIICQSGTTEALYVGMDVGVFYLDNSLSDWQFYGQGLPNTVVNELEIVSSVGKLRAATYGRGVWEAPLWDPVFTGISYSSKDEDVFLYPNPSTGDFLITLPSTCYGGKYAVTDLSGRIVYEGTVNSTPFRLSMPALETGVYIFRTGSKSAKLQIVK